ncbi:MAG: AAA family ATPase [Calothrix sp. C42_A2020_038]|nr:AAA family ATPase [Calothrix sp. C42_A2020_038]
MNVDLQKFANACNPSKTIVVSDPHDRQYYIDFAKVRGGKIIEELKNDITYFSPDEPTCGLFTGHIGCGKTTELLRLKAELEDAGFHVVYFESTQDLEIDDVDISDIMLAIARRVCESLEGLKKLELPEPRGLKKILKGAAQLLMPEVSVDAELSLLGIGDISINTEGEVSAKVPGVGEIKAQKQGVTVIAPGIGKITAKAKDSPDVRSKLREYLEPQTKSILEFINQELLEPAKQQLKQLGKCGLVVIVDNLDRVETGRKSWGRPQAEYLFIDRGEQLRQLQCHVVYTMPLSLRFSDDFGRLLDRFPVHPKVLPMVPVRQRDGSICNQGMYLMQKMVITRAFPSQQPEPTPELIALIFDTQQTIEQLCLFSGGHVRELLRILCEWIKKDRKLPLSGTTLKTLIASRCNEMNLGITDDEWELLRQVSKRKQVKGDQDYRKLIHSRLVYEYCDQQGFWFDINPILAQAPELYSSE